MVAAVIDAEQFHAFNHWREEHQRQMISDEFVEFLGQLIADHSQKVFLILDNLKAHHAKAVTRWVGEHPKQIELFYLLPYAPERNPTEYLNRDFKTQLRLSARSSTSQILRQKVERFLQFLITTPERVMAYSNHPAVHYTT